MFPISNIRADTTLEKTNDYVLKKTFKFDFETGEHIIIDGKLTECSYKESIHQFTTFLLKTEVDKYQVYYDDNFGVSIYKYIGNRFSQTGFLISELKREITEQLTELEEITDISNFNAWFEHRNLYIDFDILLENGEILNYSNQLGVS